MYQHALLLPLLLGHILYHNSLCQLEEKLEYYFKDRQVLEVYSYSYNVREVTVTVQLYREH